jgi:hypothetical protein
LAKQDAAYRSRVPHDFTQRKGGLTAKNQQILDFCGLIIHKDRGNAAIGSLGLSMNILGC